MQHCMTSFCILCKSSQINHVHGKGLCYGRTNDILGVGPH